MGLLRHTSFWTPRVMTCSALKRLQIDAVWGMVVDYCLEAKKLGAHRFLATRDAEALESVAGQFDLILSTVNVELDWCGVDRIAPRCPGDACKRLSPSL